MRIPFEVVPAQRNVFMSFGLTIRYISRVAVLVPLLASYCHGIHNDSELLEEKLMTTRRLYRSQRFTIYSDTFIFPGVGQWIILRCERQALIFLNNEFPFVDAVVAERRGRT
jgi:hypothetical protein